MRPSQIYADQARSRLSELERQASRVPPPARELIDHLLAELDLALVMLEETERENEAPAGSSAAAGAAWLEILRELDFYRALLEEAPGIVAVLNADGSFRYVSEGALGRLGLQADELAERDAFELVHSADRPRLRELFVRSRDGPESATLRCRTDDGSWCTVRLTARDATRHRVLGGLLVIGRVVEGPQAEPQTEAR